MKLPGFSLPILKFLDAKELKYATFIPFKDAVSCLLFIRADEFHIRSHTLRYVLKNKATGEVYFVIVFAVLIADEVTGEEAAEDAKKEADGVTNSMLKGVAEGGLLAAAAAGEAKAGGGAAFEPSADDVD